MSLLKNIQPNSLGDEINEVVKDTINDLRDSPEEVIGESFETFWEYAKLGTVGVAGATVRFRLVYHAVEVAMKSAAKGVTSRMGDGGLARVSQTLIHGTNSMTASQYVQLLTRYTGLASGVLGVGIVIGTIIAIKQFERYNRAKYLGWDEERVLGYKTCVPDMISNAALASSVAHTGQGFLVRATPIYVDGSVGTEEQCAKLPVTNELGRKQMISCSKEWSESALLTPTQCWQSHFEAFGDEMCPAITAIAHRFRRRKNERKDFKVNTCKKNGENIMEIAVGNILPGLGETIDIHYQPTHQEYELGDRIYRHTRFQSKRIYFNNNPSERQNVNYPPTSAKEFTGTEFITGLSLTDTPNEYTVQYSPHAPCEIFRQGLQSLLPGQLSAVEERERIVKEQSQRFGGKLSPIVDSYKISSEKFRNTESALAENSYCLDRLSPELGTRAERDILDKTTHSEKFKALSDFEKSMMEHYSHFFVNVRETHPIIAEAEHCCAMLASDAPYISDRCGEILEGVEPTTIEDLLQNVTTQ